MKGAVDSQIPLRSPPVQRDRAKRLEDGENIIEEEVARRLPTAMQLDLHQVNIVKAPAMPMMSSRPIDLIHRDMAAIINLGIHFIVQIYESHT